jgi:nucleoside-diphosphate-sugar epimerase
MILVTGGSGLLGSELITSLLADGNTVRAIYNSTPLQHNDSSTFQSFKCDILDTVGMEDAMLGVTHVYHCAGMVSFNRKKKHEVFNINVNGTINVVNAAIAEGVKKLCFVSSVAALGRLREDVLITEEMNWTEETSNSNYGKSKYLAELEVWRGIAEGLPAVIVNPSLILGGGDWSKGSSGIFKSAYDEFPWYSEGVSGFVYVKDVVKAMRMLMESEISGQRYIVNATNIGFRDVFTMIAKSFGKKPPHKRVTPFLASVVWRMEAIKAMFTGKDPLLTKETAKTAQAKVEFDNRKLMKALPGFEFTELKSAIDKTCSEMKERYKLN